jgi:uncharacterized protein (TIGR02757 family)
LPASKASLRDLLESKVEEYNQPDFIDTDPIVVPHAFSKKQDKEISGLFAATLAWGQRITIINKSLELMQMMGNAPHEFIMFHSDNDLYSLRHFKHRTFNYTDLLYFIHFLRKVYQSSESLEQFFLPLSGETTVKTGIMRFHEFFVNDGFFPARTAKHVASPARNSACKRLNMYLRWMVRSDGKGVDFGIWKKIGANQLICPCDVHVEKVARSLGLISRKQVDWKMAEELTENLRQFDPDDPAKYDFALFGMGLNKTI